MILNYPDFLYRTFINFKHRSQNPFFKNHSIISIGKSAYYMYNKFILEHPDFKNHPAIIISPSGSSAPIISDNIQIVFSTHPEISEQSFEAFQKLKNFLIETKPDKVAVLLSGGSSALIEDSLDKMNSMNLNKELLKSGLPIQEINRIRAEVSLIKGGKLAEMYSHIFWSVFVMSDIPLENGEFSVGSMPFFRKDLKNTELFKCADSNSIHDELLKVMGNEKTVSIRNFNESVEILSEIIIKNIDCGTEKFLITGEPTLKIDSDNPGIGGRMTHLALTVLPYLNYSTNFYALSTDGIDGNSPFAGAIIKNPQAILDADEINTILRNYNSADLLNKLGMTVKTGYTGINLNDFIILEKL